MTGWPPERQRRVAHLRGHRDSRTGKENFQRNGKRWRGLCEGRTVQNTCQEEAYIGCPSSKDQKPLSQLRTLPKVARKDGIGAGTKHAIWFNQFNFKTKMWSDLSAWLLQTRTLSTWTISCYPLWTQSLHSSQPDFSHVSIHSPAHFR